LDRYEKKRLRLFTQMGEWGEIVIAYKRCIEEETAFSELFTA